MLEYPKIDTLYVRDQTTHRIPKFMPERSLRRAEFSLPSRWLVTEKIDGTNVRVVFKPSAGGSGLGETVLFMGRTDKAQMPPFLLEELQRMFPVERFAGVFEDDVAAIILFGEGYGARIQKGGGNYRSGVSFRLFDVVVFGQSVTSNPFDGKVWWLNWNDVEDVAAKLHIETVPVAAREAGLGQAIRLIEEGLGSAVAWQENRSIGINAEGVVARTDPLLFDRRGHRLMWKLKECDFS